MKTPVLDPPPATVARQNPQFPGRPRPNRETNHPDLFYVVIYDNDTNTYQQVIDICMEALGITPDEAMGIALAIDNNGLAVVAQAPEGEAKRIAGIIGRIGIEVRILKDHPGA